MAKGYIAALFLLAIALSQTPSAYAVDAQWSELVSAPPSCSARTEQAAVYDPLRHRMIVFGGELGGALLGDVWTFGLQDSSGWAQLVPSGAPPVSRAEFTAIYDPIRDRVLIFGGFTNVAGVVTPLNDTWALSLSGTPAWAPLNPAGAPPPARGWHTAIHDPLRDRMIVYGGANTWSCWGEVFGDVWALSLSETPTWTPLAPAETPPPARCDHAAIYDPVRDRMIIGGGLTGGFCWGPYGTIYADLWGLSLSGAPAWSQIAVSGSLYGAMYRYGHSFVYDALRDRLLTFGGTQLNWWHELRNDVWEVTLAGAPATRQLATVGGPPDPRINHSAIYDPVDERMVVFAGEAAGVYGLRDLWQLARTPTPVNVSLVSTQATPKDVTLEWCVGEQGIGPITLERAEVNGAWALLSPVSTDGAGRILYVDRAIAAGRKYGYRLTWQEAGSTVTAGETWVDVPRAPSLSLCGIEPNPAVGELRVRFMLPVQAHARVELYDLAGRLVCSREVGSLGAGEHVVALGSGARLAPGAYLIRLTQGQKSRTLHAVLIR